MLRVDLHNITLICWVSQIKLSLMEEYPRSREPVVTIEVLMVDLCVPVAELQQALLEEHDPVAEFGEGAMTVAVLDEVEAAV